MSQANQTSTHWAQMSEFGALLGMRFLLGCYKLGKRPLFSVCLFPVIVYYFLFQQNARQASISYLTKMIRIGALPRGSLWCYSFRHFWQFANALMDKLAAWRDDIPLHRLRIEGEEIINELLQKRQGAILLISHLGNFEISRCLSRRHPGVRMTVLMHTRHAQKFNRLMRDQSSDSQLDILQVTEITPATAMMLSERASAGEFIAIAGDRVPVNHPENSIPVNFLGETAPLPMGPFLLASILKVPLVSLFCVRDNNIFNIRFSWLRKDFKLPRNERQKQLSNLAQDYADQLENECKAYPLQWFNFFDFWRQPGLNVKNKRDGFND